MRDPLIATTAPLTKVNVVPIIDVSLVLVIILLFTAPILSVPDVKLTLPVAATNASGESKSVCITLSATGATAVDEVPIQRDWITPELHRRLAEIEDKNVLVVVRADESLPHGVVRDAIAAAREAGATRLAVATRQPDKVNP